MAFANIDSPLREIDANRIFQMLISYADLCRESNDIGGFKLFVEGIRQYDDETLELLPVKKDKSLMGYHQRMQKQFPDYCLVCDELLQVSEESWEHLSQFTQQLYEAVGFPHRFSEIGLYLGNYKKTPFGVHVDNCGVFSFPAVGSKKFRIWEGSYVKKNPDLIEAHQYEQFKKNSQVLTAKPGDMTYWPSQAWHIAESDGSFSATWSLGVWVDRPHKKVMADAFEHFLKQTLGTDAELALVSTKKLSTPSGEVRALPPLYRKTLKALENVDYNLISDFLLQGWLTHASTQGLKTFPRASKQTPILKSDSVRLRFQGTLLWSKLKTSGYVCIAFAGKMHRHPSSAQFLRLLTDLNRGKICLLSNYLKGARAPRDLRLLRSLQSDGALTKPTEREIHIHN